MKLRIGLMLRASVALGTIGVSVVPSSVLAADPPPCEWFATGPVPTLIPGADEQLVVLVRRRGDDASCALPEHVVLVRDDGARLTGNFNAPSGRLSIARIPGNLAVGSPFWEVEDVDGRIELSVEAEPLAVRTDEEGHPMMTVHYSGIDMNGWHSGVSVDGVAVTTPSAEAGTWVEMTPLWQVPASIVGEAAVDPAGTGVGRAFDDCRSAPEVKATERALWEPEAGLSPTKLAELETKLDTLHRACDSNYLTGLTRSRHWRVEALNWKEGENTIHFHLAGDAWRYGWTMVRRLSEATFATTREERAPLEVAVELHDAWPTGAAGQASTTGLIRWLRLRLKAADAALEESLPLPIADALSVRCGKRQFDAQDSPDPDGAEAFDRVVYDTEMRGIRSKHLRAQGCRLFYDPHGFLARQARNGRDGSESLRLAGRQQLRVRVSRTGAAAIEKVWVIDDPTETRQLPLEVPQDTAATGPFTVEAWIDGGESPAVRYRPAPDGSARGATDATVAPADRQFTAYLRPITRGAIRGRRSEMGARVFATIPFDPLVVRFPARPDGLASSTSDTGAQVVSQRVGVAFVVEPWNFDTGKNPAFLRFETGSYLFTIADEAFDPSYFVGLKGAFPLLNLPDNTAKDQLGTDLTVGLLLEVPYSNPYPYLLMTVGFDVLSLLGSK